MALLRQLRDHLGGAVAIVSGRSIDDIDRLFPGRDIVVAGLHGLEHRLSGGPVQGVEQSDQLAPISAALREACGGFLGVIFEDKVKTLAVHFREAPEFENQIRALIESLLEGHDSLLAINGKMVIEIKPGGWDKGSAIEQFMAEAPFHGRIPVFAGDDVTDEAGFKAVRDRGGISVRVGTASETTAEYCLDDVSVAWAWLQALQKFLAESKRAG